ncbi:MAG: preprotein translocase subunit SecG [Sedimentisphaerales bacterium]|nr:preprotein translocase subunit SecG [Sedimentisphaerales bacterium]
MTTFSFVAVSFIMNVVAVLFVLCSIVLVLVILIQKGRGGGLSAAFGGGGAGSILGSKTGDFLTWVTIVMVGLFLLLAVLMAKFYRPSIGSYGGSGSAQQSQPAGSDSPPTMGEANSIDDSGSSGG